ncbi:hypothetical protein L0664_04495 [Octadecabacter sp. G9-8]|uniref:Calcineurin-like phosphoesterase domain-containing protein n=1 Tax=Octadecabacter dasysiphoniae TaxID=2909341 RepID=A0ABS9CT91_9RHOB|nr:metallophosphoesterase [Octadecabacter dasysiphoniae]MCF2870317.1 hypothetical protein [Octadecabacter dasysiphoniae]
MAHINQPPRLQLGDAPLTGYLGSETDQIVILWQTVGLIGSDAFTIEYREVGAADWVAVNTRTTNDLNLDGRIVHEVEIDGLLYGSDYEYQVTHFDADTGVTNSFSDVFQTRLAPGDDQSFSFAAYGDSAYYANSQPFFDVQGRITEMDPDFALLLGDNAYNDGTHNNFDIRLDGDDASAATLDWIAGHIDYVAFGNHDLSSGGDGHLDSYSAPIPVSGVSAPVDAPSFSVEELNYSFDYGNSHFVTFDSNQLKNAANLTSLVDYVVADLQASDAQWKIVFAHHPVGGAPDKSEGPEDNYWSELVERIYSAGADLLLVGHTHTYSWTYPLTGNANDQAMFIEDTDKVYEQGAGVVQVASGVGGRSLRVGDFTQYDFVAEGYSTTTDVQSKYGFANVSVSSTELVVDYVAADDGLIIDSFKIIAASELGVVSGTSGDDFIDADYLDDPHTEKTTNEADLIRANGGNDTIHAGEGDDTAYGGSGDDTIYGGDDKDRIYGGSGHDSLHGGDGDDYLRGQSGTDHYFGGAGVDTVSYLGSLLGVRIDLLGNSASSGDAMGESWDSVENLIGSRTANDNLLGDSAANMLSGSGGDDVVYGRNGADLLRGGDGQDRLHGNYGNDSLSGGEGADVLYGGHDDDQLSGGSDADTFYFKPGEGNDVITDFENNIDTLNFEHYGFNRSDDALAFAENVSGLGVLFDFGDGNTIQVVGSWVGHLRDDLDL